MVGWQTRTLASVAGLLALALTACAGPAGPSPPWTATTSGRTDTASAFLDAQAATAIASGYEKALRGGDPATAWALLAPGPFRPETYEDFAGRAATFQASPFRRFVVSPATRDQATLATWIDVALAADLAQRADPARAYVVLVTHPDVVDASERTEALVVAPLLDGSWRVWRAH